MLCLNVNFTRKFSHEKAVNILGHSEFTSLVIDGYICNTSACINALAYDSYILFGVQDRVDRTVVKYGMKYSNGVVIK